MSEDEVSEDEVSDKDFSDNCGENFGLWLVTCAASTTS